MRSWLISLLFVLPGCVVIDAPETIEELVVFGFEHHADSAAHREAFAEGLLPPIEDEWEGLFEGYRVDNLDADHLAGAGVEDASTESIIGALGAAEYVHGIDDVVWAITYPDKAEVFDNYEAYSVEDDDDRACFLARECDTFRQTIEQTVDVVLVNSATTRLRKDHRWVELPGMEPFVIGRTLAPEPVELGNPIIEVHQQYDIFLVFPRGGAAARVESVWIDASFLDLELPDTFLIDQSVNGMQNQAERIDALVDAER